MRPFVTGLLILGSITVGGCTKHLRVTPAGDSVASRSGFAYPLQFTQYSIKVTRRVADCESAGLPTAEIKAEVVTTNVDDGDHMYVISSNSLISPMKISNLQIAWEEGRLKSVNASAEDRTAQIATAVVQGIGKLAMSQLVGVVGQGNQQPQCNQKTKDNVALAKLKSEEIEGLDKKMAAARLALAQIEAKLVKDPKNQTWLGDLAAKITELEGYDAELTKAKKALTGALEELTVTTTLLWPQNGNEFVSQPNRLTPAQLARWVDVPAERMASGELEEEVDRAARQERIADRFQVFFRIERVGTYGRKPVNGESGSADTAPAEAGMRYRMPASGMLVICQESLCSSTDGKKVILASPSPIQQLGQIFYVPFSSPVFSNGAMNISFDKLGRPVAAGVGRSTASAETAATAFRDIAGEAATIANSLYETPAERLQRQLAIVKLEKELKDAREAGATPLDIVKKETELLRAQQELAQAREALEQTPTEDLRRETELLLAKKAHLDALRALEANPNAVTGAATAGFQADTALLLAEKAKIEAEIALIEARRKKDGL